MKQIVTGIIGTGFIGPAHIEALRRLGKVNIKALADVDEATAAKKTAELSIPVYYGDYRQLLADRQIQAVHICTPNFLHYIMAKEALLAGKHVVCEKPLAVTSEEAKELVSIAKDKGLANAVGFNLRFYPLVHQIKMMVENGELGNIFAINGSYQQDWLFFETDYNWRLNPKLSGESRAVADIGSHWMDMVEFVTGCKIVRLCADFATFHKRRFKPLKEVETYAGKILSAEDYEPIEINTEDYATVLLRFNNGAHGSMTVNQVAAGRKNRIYLEIYGSKKSVAWSGERPNELWIGRRDGNNEIMLKDPSLVGENVREIISFPGGHNEGFPDTSKQLFKKFYSYLEHGQKKEPDFPTFTDGLRELILCEKICASAKEERWVQV